MLLDLKGNHKEHRNPFRRSRYVLKRDTIGTTISFAGFLVRLIWGLLDGFWGSYQSQKMVVWLFPFNPPLNGGDFDHNKEASSCLRESKKETHPRQEVLSEARVSTWGGYLDMSLQMRPGSDVEKVKQRFFFGLVLSDEETFQHMFSPF